jgi:hypothetical protein
MTVRLHLRRIRAVKVLHDDEAELVMEVADTQSVKRCPSCGARAARVHETRRRRVRDLPSLGRPTTLVVQVRRFECPTGHRFTPEHPDLAGGSPAVWPAAWCLMSDVRRLTIRELARRHHLGWHLIMGVVRGWAVTVAAQRRAERCRVLMVDETSLRRGHRYVTVLLIMWVVPAVLAMLLWPPAPTRHLTGVTLATAPLMSVGSTRGETEVKGMTSFASFVRSRGPRNGSDKSEVFGHEEVGVTERSSPWSERCKPATNTSRSGQRSRSATTVTLNWPA